MKKTILLISTVALITLVGCGKPHTYGVIADWSQYDTDDCHVKYAVGADGCYSDGSIDSDMQFNYWLEQYEEKHN